MQSPWGGGLSNLVQVYRAYRPRYTDLSGRLAATDALIDQVVYRLYGLSEDEVAIVEGRVKRTEHFTLPGTGQK